MLEKKDLRRRNMPISYEISSDSGGSSTSSQDESPYITPEKPSRHRSNATELGAEWEDEEDSPVKTPPPRLSSAGHSLRQPKELQSSLRAQENADKRVRKRRRLSNPVKTPTVIKPLPLSERTKIRESIATDTAVKRANFMIAHKDLFLPLLPKDNHIDRLLQQRSHELHRSSDPNSRPSELEISVPYETISKQPQGVKATMKPYQLAGLSFLVYLYRNGMSGILGDEMGLGKTLQTLALIQYLKEYRRQAEPESEARPCLVVCPLSVLSSWMAEARRWTPDLKVIRFHGPVNERARLKRIATGEEDAWGNTTKKARINKRNRVIKAGKSNVLLDPDSDPTDEPDVDLIVTTYEGFKAEQGWFKTAFAWKYVILDEGHKIKNDASQISRSLQGLAAEYRLILTGTPLQNDMLELWALLHWLYPEVFTDPTAESFKTSFDLSHGTVNTKFMDDARRLLERIMLRRMKNSEGVNLGLPPKTEVLLYMPLTPMQRFWYTRLITRADQGLLDELFQDAQKKEILAFQQETQEKQEWENKGVEELEALEKNAGDATWEESKAILKQALEQEQQDESKKSAWRKLMNLLMQLRKCCNHPYLLPHAGPDPYYLGEHIIHSSAKFIVLDKIIDQLVIKQKKKVLIFSGFTRMLDCCEDFLALRGGTGQQFRYTRLDGSTARARRNLSIRIFNQENSEHRVMLISTKAGGLGINLATASDVILLDQDWNPQITLQAEARSHRIGQKNAVTVYKLCTQGTVEEQMMGRIQKKLYLSAKVTESMRNVHSVKGQKRASSGRTAIEEDMPQLRTSELMSLVRHGAQALAHPELDINDMLNWDWPTMLEKCKDKPSDIHVSQDTGATNGIENEDEEKWLSQMEQVKSRIFQGKKYHRPSEVSGYKDISQSWDREQRRIGKETTIMVDGYAISKESMSCGDWEAVPTMAGKDPRLSEPKREKKLAVINQDHCQVCWDGGELTLCSGCPRSYHYNCLDAETKARSRGQITFNCTQHQCWDCQQKTAEAGGMIFRCRWCEKGFCEDCLDWEKTDLLGENLREYELLNFPAVAQAFYIRCHSCTDYHAESRHAREFFEYRADEIDLGYQIWLDEKAAVEAQETPNLTKLSSRAESLTDATTLDESGLSTPKNGAVEPPTFSGKSKRKVAPESFGFQKTPPSSKRKVAPKSFGFQKTPPSSKRAKRVASSSVNYAPWAFDIEA
ncbi:MAG: hypothetical protein LQ342_004996 [Letrouitia transgressa]|nr:MAG: hypothetical protein LQ342_004996 [Letrouitia transgressa]